MSGEDSVADVSFDRFNPPVSVRRLHSFPRFGHGSDVSKLFSYEKTEQVDYGVGLVLVTAFLLSFFTFWFVVLFILKCMGQYRVGFLSGYRFVEPYPSVPGKRRVFRRPRRVRMTFLVCASLVILYAVLFVTHGVRNMQDTTSKLMSTSSDVRKIMSEAESLAESLKEIGQEAAPLRDEVVNNLDDFCPDGNVEERTGVDFDSLADEATEKLTLLQDFIENDVATLDENLSRLEEGADETDSVFELISKYDWIQMIIVIPLVVLPALFIVGVLLSWMELSVWYFTLLQTWVLFPLFGVWIVVCYVLCSVCGVVAISNADVCSGGETEVVNGSPEGTVKAVLAEQGYDSKDSLLYRSVLYYIDGCFSGDYPFDFVDTYIVELEQARDAVNAFLDEINDVGLEQLSVVCGLQVQRLEEVRLLVVNVRDQLVQLLADGNAALNILDCPRINGIYENASHDAMCASSIAGLSWMFSSLLIISVMGMLMLTFRASIHDVEYLDDDVDQDHLTEQGVELEYVEPGANDVEQEEGEYDGENKGQMLESKTTGTSNENEFDEEEMLNEGSKRDDGYDSSQSWEKYPTVLNRPVRNESDD